MKNIILTFILTAPFVAAAAPNIHSTNAGPNIIHVTKFAIPLIRRVNVHVVGQFGHGSGNDCPTERTIEEDVLAADGYSYAILGDEIKAKIGSGFTCAKYDYQESYEKGRGHESFSIISSGDNYISTEPYKSRVGFAIKKEGLKSPPKN